MTGATLAPLTSVEPLSEIRRQSSAEALLRDADAARQALIATGGCISRAARALGCHRTSLIRLVHRAGLKSLVVAAPGGRPRKQV